MSPVGLTSCEKTLKCGFLVYVIRLHAVKSKSGDESSIGYLCSFLYKGG